jgi:hypothetical protein
VPPRSAARVSAVARPVLVRMRSSSPITLSCRPTPVPASRRRPRRHQNRPITRQ